jgi:N-acetylglucosamine malate deacetylase 1
MKIVVVSPHPDDMELSCSGTLRRYQEQGAEIISVVAVKPSVEDNRSRTQEIVLTELTNSYALSNFELRMLDTDLHENGRPNLVCNNNTMTQLSRLLEPADLVILPNPEDSHQDHRTTFELAWPLVKNKAKEVWVAHSWPYCTTYGNTANTYVDISDQFDFKMSLLRCYTSYLTDENLHGVTVTSQWYGQICKTKHAEAFTLKQRLI